MECFNIRSNINSLPVASCAEKLVSTIPLVMGVLRTEMRAHRPDELSIPQFRAMIYLDRHQGASVSRVAEHLGLALSSTSQTIDGLVKRQYVQRETAEGDRRRAIVSLTPTGKMILDSVRTQAQARIAERLGALSSEELAAVDIVMQAFDRIFSAH